MAPVLRRTTNNAAGYGWEQYCMAGECMPITGWFCKELYKSGTFFFGTFVG
jgi:hypothetical protein